MVQREINDQSTVGKPSLPTYVQVGSQSKIEIISPGKPSRLSTPHALPNVDRGPFGFILGLRKPINIFQIFTSFGDSIEM